MKGSSTVLVVLGGLFLGALLLFVIGCSVTVGAYNSMVDKENAVDKAWANVDVQLQRRYDLVPNLVATVQGIADQERAVFTEVTRLRSQIGQVTLDPSNSEEVAEYIALQNQFHSAIGRLLVVVENYPEIRSQQNFLELQAQLEGTENRIAVARKDYNDAVTDYNNTVRKFPGNFFAGIFGFDPRLLFEAAEGADKTPDIDFDIPDSR